MYNEILTLIFSNQKNFEYFKKYYGNTPNFQKMFQDWKNISKTDKNNFLTCLYEQEHGEN